MPVVPLVLSGGNKRLSEPMHLEEIQFVRRHGGRLIPSRVSYQSSNFNGGAERIYHLRKKVTGTVGERGVGLIVG